MICQGYGKQGAHEVDHLYSLGLCALCYHRKYYEDHRDAITEFQRAYQVAYRGDEAYKTANRLYAKRFRDKKPH